MSRFARKLHKLLGIDRESEEERRKMGCVAWIFGFIIAMFLTPMMVFSILQESFPDVEESTAGWISVGSMIAVAFLYEWIVDPK